MLAKRLIKSNDAGGGGCTNTIDNYNPFPDGGGLALYQLNGDATDVSGNYDGTATNVTYGAGEFGQAGVFNGSSSEITNSGTVNVDLDFSVSLWFNNQGAGVHPAQCLWSGKNRDNSLQFNFTNNTVVFFLYDGTLRDVQTSTILSGWNNVVLTRSKTSGLKIYLNGSLQDTNSFTGNASALTATETIGNLGRAGIDRFFNGSIDQVRIFSRALRPYEVEALYTEEYCTPTIVPSEHFNTVLYTGSGSDGLAVTGAGFSPDFVWIKPRTQADNHNIYDTLRGVRQQIIPNNTSAESTQPRTLQSFDADGFTLNDDNNVNNPGIDYVSWNFKAGGAAVAANSVEATSATRSANSDAGFSVIKFQSSTSTVQPPPMNYIEHGLNSAPKMVIYKRTNASQDWIVQHDGITTNGDLKLNLTNAQSGPFTYDFFDNTETSIGVRSNYAISRNEPYIAYCFAEVEGFSSFGSFIGTGTTEGQLVVTGFEPAFVMWKKSSNASSAHWNIVDNKRSPLKDKNNVLYSNLSQGEDVTSYDIIDFNANGFQVKAPYSQFNESGATFIYMAFAADPTTVEPTLEDSFNTVLYTGNGTKPNGPVLNFGFQPDLVWIKQRNAVRTHRLNDSVRGDYSTLSSDTTDAENLSTTDVRVNFDYSSTSARVETASAGWNASGQDFVAWAWKGAELPAINSNGSIPSVVSANPAAGFSIVTHTSSMLSSQSIGHGLNSTPKIVISKVRNIADSWWVFMPDVIGSTNVLELNATAAARSVGLTFNANDTTFNIQWTSASYDFLHYCFAEVAGFSKFGSYAGTGGVLSEQTLGFEPAFIMIKRTDSTGDWFVYDNKRDTANPRTVGLYANLSNAEYNTSGSPGYADINFLSNGFSLNASYVGINGSGGTFIYMAFANQF